MNELTIRAKITNLEALISVYSEFDNVRTKELSAQVRTLELELLDLMTEFNTEWLELNRIAA